MPKNSYKRLHRLQVVAFLLRLLSHCCWCSKITIKLIMIISYRHRVVRRVCDPSTQHSNMIFWPMFSVIFHVPIMRGEREKKTKNAIMWFHMSKHNVMFSSRKWFVGCLRWLAKISSLSSFSSTSNTTIFLAQATETIFFKLINCAKVLSSVKSLQLTLSLASNDNLPKTLFCRSIVMRSDRLDRETGIDSCSSARLAARTHNQRPSPIKNFRNVGQVNSQLHPKTDFELLSIISHFAFSHLLSISDTKNSVGLVGLIEEISHNAIAVYWNPLESSAKVSQFFKFNLSYKWKYTNWRRHFAC